MLHWNLNFKKCPERVKQIMKDARLHLHWMIRIYQRQLDRGKHFVHEHPETARSWKDPRMEAFLQDPRIVTTVSDQCEYGSLMLSDYGRPLPYKTPTNGLPRLYT